MATFRCDLSGSWVYMDFWMRLWGNECGFQ